jgi:uncharacterized protein (UPF0276 family)
MDLPDLGVGFVYLPGLEPLFESLCPLLDVVEVEPQTFWTHAPPLAGGGTAALRVNRDKLERARGLGRPMLVHSVGYPVGGSRSGDARHRAALRETFSILKPAWWSEHASFLAVHDGGEPRHIGFLMPPVQSAESVATIAARIMRLQDEFGLPFAFETGANYLRPVIGELSDGDFWGEIADRADCGILLDLHNVWTNAVNGRQPLAALAGRLPLERVWEVHVAGGQWHKGYWLDSHSGLPPDGVLDVAAALVPKLPALRAIVLEIIPDQIEAKRISQEDIAACLSALRAIWAARGSAVRGERTRPRRGGETLPSMGEWELALEAALRTGEEGAPGPFAGDPGLEIYRDLIGMARRGTLVEALPLSMRYLHRALGPAGLERIFASFWRRAAPEPFMSDEALSFSGFVASEIRLPHLDEVIAFELAAHRAAMTGVPQYVPFSCEPEPLLMSLKNGASPLAIHPAEIEVEVTPPASSRAAAAA